MSACDHKMKYECSVVAVWCPDCGKTDTVRENERLRAERDNWQEMHHVAVRERDTVRSDFDALNRRTLELERERDEARAELSYMVQGYRDQKQRAERAEADAARLKERVAELLAAVEDLLPHLPQGEPFGAEKHSAHKRAAWRVIQARAALAGEEVK